jgi:hypothetical protein
LSPDPKFTTQPDVSSVVLCIAGLAVPYPVNEPIARVIAFVPTFRTSIVEVPKNRT